MTRRSTYARRSSMRTRVLAIALALPALVCVESVCAAAPTGTSPQPVTPAQTLTPSYPTCPPGKVVSKDDSDEAHYRYKAGKLEYDEANYSTAIARFLAAYTLDCTKHELLVIISRSFDLADNKAEAIRALELYLERATVSPVEATSIRARIANMKKQLAEKPATPPTATPPPATTSPSSAPPSSPPPTTTETREHTVYPWLVVGGGAVVAVVGVVLYAVGRGDLPEGCDEAKGSCVTPILAGETEEQRLARDLQRREKAGDAKTTWSLGYGGMAIGGAAIGLGLLWHFLEPTGPVEKASSRRPNVTPSLAPGFAGLGIGGRF